MYDVEVEQTPKQAAIAEQAIREAAVERARRKLVTAREMPAGGVGDWPWLVPTVLQAIVCIFLFIVCWLSLRNMPQIDMATWNVRDLPVETFYIALSFGFAAWFAVVFWRRWRGEPALVVRTFFERASDRRQRDNLYRVVIAADLDDTPRRLPAGDSRTSVNEAERPMTLTDYWRRVLERGRWTVGSLRVTGCRTIPLAPDLVLAQARVVETKSLRSGIADWLFSVVIFGPIFLFSSTHQVVAWAGMLVVLTVYAATPIVYGWMFGRPIRIQKLLVRVGKQWRMFAGEWQAIEEADLSWLDVPASTEPPAIKH